MIGNAIDTGTNNDKSLKEPPVIPGKNERDNGINLGEPLLSWRQNNP